MPTKKSSGKPYAGKLHVRFEEGVTKLSKDSFVLYSTVLIFIPYFSHIYEPFSSFTVNIILN
jgi:hypothetical protein